MVRAAPRIAFRLAELMVGRSSRCILRLARRQFQYVALLPRAAYAARDLDEHLLHLGAAVHGIGVAVPRAAAMRRLVERVAGVPGNMGVLRIPAQCQFAPRHGGHSLLFTTEFSSVPATCLRHRPLGHEFFAAAISCHARHLRASTSCGAEAGVANCWGGAGRDCAGADLWRSAPGAPNAGSTSKGRP